MKDEQYIEHEVQLRVHDERFKVQDERFVRLESKMNWLISLVIGGWLVPIGLHFMKLG
jgi:hypothetical protein